MSPDANGAHAGEMTPVANTILDGVVLIHTLNLTGVDLQSKIFLYFIAKRRDSLLLDILKDDVIVALLQHGGILTGALCKATDQVTHSI